MKITKVGKRDHYKGQFLQHDLAFVTQRAANLLEVLLALPEYKRSDGEGGVLVLAPDEASITHFSAALGDVPENDPTKYYRFALKKCQAFQTNKKALSSHDLRNERMGIFGGGITFECKWNRGYTHIPITTDSFAAFTTKASIAFSGLSEHADEALVLVLAIILEWISIGQARKISIASANPFFEALLKASH